MSAKTKELLSPWISDHEVNKTETKRKTKRRGSRRGVMDARGFWKEEGESYHMGRLLECFRNYRGPHREDGRVGLGEDPFPAEGPRFPIPKVEKEEGRGIKTGSSLTFPKGARGLLEEELL